MRIWPGQPVVTEETNEESSEECVPQGIRIIIDQPEILGVLPDLERHIAGWPGRGANVAFVMAVRERSILNELYGARAYGLPDAFETHLVLTGMSQADSAFYAEYCSYRPAAVEAEVIEDHAQAGLSYPITPALLRRLKNGRALLCPIDLPPAIITYP